MSQLNTVVGKSKRQFLKNTAKITMLAGTLATAPNALSAALTAPVHGPDRKLRLVNAHTWEKLDIVFWSQGQYISENLDQIDNLMRDHRANKAIAMDAKLIDDLYTLYTTLDTDKRILVLSGYRTPETNAKLRKRSTAVARNSLHMEGRAVDIQVQGTSVKQVRDVAVGLRRGGVGYYASSGFVHIDTGSVRSWAQS